MAYVMRLYSSFWCYVSFMYVSWACNSRRCSFSNFVCNVNRKWSHHLCQAMGSLYHRRTVYTQKYAHGSCFAVLCCGYTLTDFPISIRLTSLALWQSNDCPSASKATLINMDKYFMWIHYERLHNHNKAKHNKTVCIFLGMYCNMHWTDLTIYNDWLELFRFVKLLLPGEHASFFSEVNLRIMIWGLFLLLTVMFLGPVYGWGEYSQFRGKCNVIGLTTHTWDSELGYHWFR